MSLIGILVGVLLLVLEAGVLIKTVSILFGVVILISSIPDIVVGIAATRKGQGAFSLVVALLTAVLGGVLIFCHERLVYILMGVVLIVLPTLQLILSKERKQLLGRLLPQILLGVVLLMMGPATVLNVLFDVAGIVVLVMTLVYIISMLLYLRRSVHKTGNRIFVDENSDGHVDAVLVDTTGDGRADFSVRFRRPRK